MPKTAAQRRAQWDKDRADVCDQWGLTTEQADALLDAMPYSEIPDWANVAYVLLTIEEIWPEVKR